MTSERTSHTGRAVLRCSDRAEASTSAVGALWKAATSLVGRPAGVVSHAASAGLHVLKRCRTSQPGNAALHSCSKLSLQLLLIPSALLAARSAFTIPGIAK